MLQAHFQGEITRIGVTRTLEFYWYLGIIISRCEKSIGWTAILDHNLRIEGMMSTAAVCDALFAHIEPGSRSEELGSERPRHPAVPIIQG